MKSVFQKFQALPLHADQGFHSAEAWGQRCVSHFPNLGKPRSHVPSAKQAAEFSIVTAIIKSVETTRLLVTDSLHTFRAPLPQKPLTGRVRPGRNTFCSWEMLCGCAPLWHYSDHNPYLCSHAGNKVISSFCSPGDNVSARSHCCHTGARQLYASA